MSPTMKQLIWKTAFYSLCKRNQSFTG